MADFTQESRVICEFLKLEWVEGMEDFGARDDA